MPFFICPRCKTRRLDHDGREGLSQEPPSCHHCDFGFMFELLEDYYPAPATGFVVCDQEGRILASGHGVFELSGYEEPELMGRDVAEAFTLLRYGGDRNGSGMGRSPARQGAHGAHARRDREEGRGRLLPGL